MKNKINIVAILLYFIAIACFICGVANIVETNKYKIDIKYEDTIAERDTLIKDIEDIKKSYPGDYESQDSYKTKKSSLEVQESLIKFYDDEIKEKNTTSVIMLVSGGVAVGLGIAVPFIKRKQLKRIGK